MNFKALFIIMFSVVVLLGCSNNEASTITTMSQEGTVHLAIQEVAEAQKRDLEEGEQRERNIEVFKGFYPPDEESIPTFSSNIIEENYDIIYQSAVSDGRALDRSNYSFELIETSENEFLLFHLTYPIDDEYYIQGVYEIPDDVAHFFEDILSN